MISRPFVLLLPSGAHLGALVSSANTAIKTESPLGGQNSGAQFGLPRSRGEPDGTNVLVAVLNSSWPSVAVATIFDRRFAGLGRSFSS